MPNPPVSEAGPAPRWMERLRRALRPPRRAIPTVPGLFALGAPTFLGLAAVTATNNLLFILLGATLGAVVLSGILSERAVRPLGVRIRPAGAAHATEPCRLEVWIGRPSARAPQFDLRVRELGRERGWPWRRRRPAPGELLDVHLPVLEGREGSVVGVRRFDRRGRARLGPCEISTRFPFGLLVKAKDVHPELEVWVRPRRVDLPLELARPPGAAGEGTAEARRGQGTDLYGLRERKEHDPAHRVHALRSLAVGREVVLEMVAEERPRATLGVVTSSAADPEALERALEIAQAALRSWSEAGFAVGLVTFDRLFAPGEAPLGRLLDHLAEVGPSPTGPPRRAGAVAWLVPAMAAVPPGVSGFRVLADGRVEPA